MRKKNVIKKNVSGGKKNWNKFTLHEKKLCDKFILKKMFLCG